MRGEQVYASTKREPLGVGINRGYNFPKATEDPEFKSAAPAQLPQPSPAKGWMGRGCRRWPFRRGVRRLGF